VSIADYAHWNEDAAMMWWLEEGQHSQYSDPYENEDYEDLDYNDFDDEDE
jgi:hypothetical protein